LHFDAHKIQTIDRFSHQSPPGPSLRHLAEKQPNPLRINTNPAVKPRRRAHPSLTHSLFHLFTGLFAHNYPPPAHTQTMSPKSALGPESHTRHPIPHPKIRNHCSSFFR
jgi:hypothetical protein